VFIPAFLTTRPKFVSMNILVVSIIIADPGMFIMISFWIGLKL
jgi:hypothetical protein